MTASSALIGVILGFALSEGSRLLGGWRRNKTNFKAIKSEVDYCSELAEVYLGDRIMAPLYRLPTNAYEASLPQLLSSSVINEDELKAVQKFYMEVESFNRGLDQAELNRGLDQAELARSDEARLNAEFKKNLGKASYLTDSAGNEKNYYKGLNRLLSKRCD